MIAGRIDRHMTGSGHEHRARMWEMLAWQHYRRMSKALADTPLTEIRRVREVRGRVEAARLDFANAWRALEAVTQ